MIPVTVINLARSIDRRECIAAQLAALGISFNVFPAIDGAQLTPDDCARLASDLSRGYYRPLIANEIACAASHLEVIRGIAAGGDGFACVLEDDAIPSAEFVAALRAETLVRLPAFDVLRLGPRRVRRWRLAYRCGAIDQIGFRAVPVMYRSYGCQAQIYSRRGARHIVAALPHVRAPIDESLFGECHVPGLRVLETVPALVEFQSAAPSTIGPIPPLYRSRLARNLWHHRRAMLGLRNFWQAWGVRGVVGLRIDGRP